jgi:hypothetical protein
MRLEHMAQTGDYCDKSGIYFISDGCDHAAQRTIIKGHRFPVCYVCGAQANWTLLREWHGEQEEPAEQS